MALARSRPEPGDTAALVVDDLAVARGGRTVVAGISFRLDRGEALQIVGDNGAGKSTLLRAIAGLLPPQAGTARMTGVPSETPLAEQSHYLGHADGLKGALTAGENLAVAAALLGGSSAPAPPATPEAALTRLGLGHLLDLPAAYLSAGQRRRVALARLLVAPRLLWLLDEPTTALDAAAQERLAAIMSAHRTQGGMIIAATHAALGLERGRVLRLGA